MLELITPQQMREADRAAIEAGISGNELMARAGKVTADAVLRLYPEAHRIAVMCGPGNNGGDGFVIARLLREAGRSVQLFCTIGRDKLKGDAAEAAHAWPGAIEPSDAGPGTCDLVIDALLGAGLTRNVGSDFALAIDRITGAGCPVVSVDLPSGIDGTTGAVRGSAVRADVTVTFGRLKPGHMLVPGRHYCGRRVIGDIGITPGIFASLGSTASANRPGLWQLDLPQFDPAAHKYDRGHVGVVSGPRHATGAARLAVRAAQRAGAGLVTALADEPAADVLATVLESAMVRVAENPHRLGQLVERGKISTAVIGPGCGVGEGTRAGVATLASHDISLVLDADALTSFEHRSDELRTMLRGRSQNTILTPHAGEFARLCGEPGQDGKLTASLEAAREYGAIIVFKGADTVVASPDGRASIADNAPPWLATAGAGDVLAGLIAGLLAQGMPAFEAASAAVWIHGEAATIVGEGLISEDLPDVFPIVRARLSPATPRWAYDDPLQRL